jgi:hypothetical protein
MRQSWGWRAVTFHPKIFLFAIIIAVWLLVQCTRPLGKILHVSAFLLLVPFAFFLAWIIVIAVAIWNYCVVYGASQDDLCVRYTACETLFADVSAGLRCCETA